MFGLRWSTCCGQISTGGWKKSSCLVDVCLCVCSEVVRCWRTVASVHRALSSSSGLDAERQESRLEGMCAGKQRVLRGCLKARDEKLGVNKSRLFHVRYEICIEPFQIGPFMFEND